MSDVVDESSNDSIGTVLMDASDRESPVLEVVESPDSAAVGKLPVCFSWLISFEDNFG
jgi:hypothetical protein